MAWECESVKIFELNFDTYRKASTLKEVLENQIE